MEVYEGQYHCFGMGLKFFNIGKDMDAAVLKLFQDIHSFFGQHLKSQLTPVPASAQ